MANLSACQFVIIHKVPLNHFNLYFFGRVKFSPVKFDNSVKNSFISVTVILILVEPDFSIFIYDILSRVHLIFAHGGSDQSVNASLHRAADLVHFLSSSFSQLIFVVVVIVRARCQFGPCIESVQLCLVHHYQRLLLSFDFEVQGFHSNGNLLD